MAPDLSSLPPSAQATPVSPRLPSSRRASQQISLPPSSSSLNILPSNQSTVNPTASPLISPTGHNINSPGPVGDNTGVGAGPGPLRHPRPLTAVDLHLQLEKEHEAVINRLTRELSMLRAAQNASVVSNTSSTSAGLPDSGDYNANHLLSGPSHPTPSQRRHHRSSSSTSTRSITAGSFSTVGATAGSVASGLVPDRSRGTLPRQDSVSQSQSMSRQNSTTGSRRSGASSPALLSSSYQNPDHLAYFHQQRPAIPQRELSSGNTHVSSNGEHFRADSVTSVQTTGRYEETAYHKHELDSVKRENETLKRRIRELERTLRARRQSDASRTRSESVSTTASVGFRDNVTGVGRGREREKDGEDDVVRVGESARSAGVLR